jgi:hypothetical protein
MIPLLNLQKKMIIDHYLHYNKSYKKQFNTQGNIKVLIITLF